MSRTRIHFKHVINIRICGLVIISILQGKSSSGVFSPVPLLRKIFPEGWQTVSIITARILKRNPIRPLWPLPDMSRRQHTLTQKSISKQGCWQVNLKKAKPLQMVRGTVCWQQALLTFPRTIPCQRLSGGWRSLAGGRWGERSWVFFFLRNYLLPVSLASFKAAGAPQGKMEERQRISFSFPFYFWQLIDGRSWLRWKFSCRWQDSFSS